MLVLLCMVCCGSFSMPCKPTDSSHSVLIICYSLHIIGKWHLSVMSQQDYTYDKAVDIVQQCGFDAVKGACVRAFHLGLFLCLE